MQQTDLLTQDVTLLQMMGLLRSEIKVQYLEEIAQEKPCLPKVGHGKNCQVGLQQWFI